MRVDLWLVSCDLISDVKPFVFVYIHMYIYTIYIYILPFISKSMVKIDDLLLFMTQVVHQISHNLYRWTLLQSLRCSFKTHQHSCLQMTGLTVENVHLYYHGEQVNALSPTKECRRFFLYTSSARTTPCIRVEYFFRKVNRFTFNWMEPINATKHIHCMRIYLLNTITYFIMAHYYLQPKEGSISRHKTLLISM